MTVRPSPGTFDLDAILLAQEQKSLLRFITCGSVDDGKSTLIGRLLYESKRLFDDQIAALESESRKIGTQAGALDFALLVDGLAAEREQGITIDVAYRFFSTERRTFIVADTPGHEQYTSNMATGASTADLAVLLVDARKGLTRQTRRHALLVSMLGIRHVVLAVNKMDLVGWSQETFRAIARNFRGFAAGLGFEEIVEIPLSALGGDNLTHPSVHTGWYGGPTLLEHLETVEIEEGSEGAPFRMPVQWVNRPSPDFRGYAGLITGGRLRRGERVRVLPSGREAVVDRIVTADGDLEVAQSGQAVTLTFTTEIDVSRGDVVAALEAPPQVGRRIVARLFWTGSRALTEGSSFWLKVGTASVRATVAAVQARIDLDTLAATPAKGLDVNDIGDVELILDRPVAFDAYERNRDTGGFILVDPQGFDTVAIGLIRESRDHSGAGEPSGLRLAILRAWRPVTGEAQWRSLAKAVSWRITGSLDTMLLAFLFTQDARVSAAIGLTEVATKLVLYYGHERLWARIGFGLPGRRRDNGGNGAPA